MKPDKYVENVKSENKEVIENLKNVFYKGSSVSDWLSDMLDKSFYDKIDEKPNCWSFPQNIKKTNMVWQHITNLPTGTVDNKDLYRSNERMQNFLCSEHTLDQTVGFLMLRQNKYTGLYFGAASKQGGSDIPDQLRENMQLNFMGARMESMPAATKRTEGYFDSVEYKLNQMPYVGVITGQPSLRSDEKENPLQSLDRLTSGIINYNEGKERDYALLVISEPVSDAETKSLIKQMNGLKSSLHEFAAYNESNSTSEGSSSGKSSSKGLSFSVGLIALAISVVGVGLAGPAAIGPLSGAVALLGNVGMNISKSKYSSISASISDSISKEHVNYDVKYCESLLDKAIKRMQNGRNLGFWNTGIYVLGDSAETVNLVMSELRSIYSGENTYQEPIRTFSFDKSYQVKEYIDNLQFLPVPIKSTDYKDVLEIRNNASAANQGNWHVFGKMYEYMSTPMNTEELSIVMSLPKKDVAGIHVKRDAVEFATNPPVMKKDTRKIELGEIIDMGASTNHSYFLDIDQLNRHGIIVGLNGGGKSVTSRAILKGMLDNDIPFMIIDPVKTDYVFWADNYNKAHKNDPGFKPIKIIAPGLKSINGIETELFPLKMNPFKPCAAKGAKLDMQGHIGSLLGLLNKTMAMGSFLPMLLEEAVFAYIESALGGDYAERSDVDYGEIDERNYPKLSGLVGSENSVVDRILEERRYSKENTDNFRAAITTRINSLTRGWKKDFFEADVSTAPEEIFESNVVVCLAGITNNSDKSFFMSLLLNAASEYRISRYQYDDEYRKTVTQGRKQYNGNYLAHYTVVEEAHRILQVPSVLASDADPQAAAAEKFCEMLSEIRESGEGLMIIDQYPSRLVADAIKNTNLKIIHRLQAADDREAMAGCMSLNSTQSMMLASLKKGDAVVNSEQDDAAMWLHINMR